MLRLARADFGLMLLPPSFQLGFDVQIHASLLMYVSYSKIFTYIFFSNRIFNAYFIHSLTDSFQ